MSGPSSSQNPERPGNIPVDPMQVPAVPLQSPEVQAIEPGNANVPVDPVQPLELQAERPAEDNAPGACAPLSSSGSSDSVGSPLEHMASLDISPSTPATSSTLGSSKTPTLSTDMEEGSPLTETLSSEDSGEGGEALTSEQMRQELNKIASKNEQQSMQKSVSDVDSQTQKEAPEGFAGCATEPKPIQVKDALGNIQRRLPPLPKPASFPAPLDVPPPRPRLTALPPIPGAVVAHLMKSSLPVLPPVAGTTGGHEPSLPSKKSRGLSKQSSDDSSLSTTSESVQSESDSPKKPTHSKMDDLKRRDSSDGSRADESSMSVDSLEVHKKKALHKKVPKETTETTSSPKVIREIPNLSRADTLDDVDAIKTDSVSFHSNLRGRLRPLIPDRDRRSFSLPANPPTKDQGMAPQERRAYSEDKEQEMEVLLAPPNQSLNTSISWQSSDTVDPPPSGVKSEPVKKVTEKATPVLQAISEGHSPLPPEDQPSGVSSPCVLMEDDPEVVAYAGDLSASNSDVDPRRERPRRADKDAERQMREFYEAIAGAEQVSGTDPNSPSSTSSDNSAAQAIAGYSGWLPRNPQNVSDDDKANQSRSSSDLSRSKSDSSSDQYVQMQLQGWFIGSKDQSGPSGVGKTSQHSEGMDTLAVVSEKAESSSVSGSLSPAGMEGSEDSSKSLDRLESTESKDDSSADVEMVEPEKGDRKSLLVVNLKDDDALKTAKRKREPKKSTDDSPQDPALLSPEADSKKYRSESDEFRPVVAGQIAKSSSTGTVKPGQDQRVDIESFKKLAEKRRKSPSPDSGESAKDPKDKSKEDDSKDKQEPGT